MFPKNAYLKLSNRFINFFQRRILFKRHQYFKGRLFCDLYECCICSLGRDDDVTTDCAVFQMSVENGRIHTPVDNVIKYLILKTKQDRCTYTHTHTKQTENERLVVTKNQPAVMATRWN